MRYEGFESESGLGQGTHVSVAADADEGCLFATKEKNYEDHKSFYPDLSIITLESNHPRA